MNVSWDDDIPNIWEVIKLYKIHVPVTTNQQYQCVSAGIETPIFRTKNHGVMDIWQWVQTELFSPKSGPWAFGRLHPRAF
jgi:hypothetical protein